MLLSPRWLTLVTIITLFIVLTPSVIAEELSDFSSDGCSQFPDGTFAQKNLWCDCCIAHDIAYWQGGSKIKKAQADKGLRTCVFSKTNNQLLADTMYFGVTIGGSPIYPVWYRWGYGWSYGRGFQVLNQLEKKQVEVKLKHYFEMATPGFCDFEHPVKLMIEKELRDFLSQQK